MKNMHMKTLLICTDFSDAALHAARYGCMLATKYGFGYITLFHAWQAIVTTTTLPLHTYEDEDKEMAKASIEQLKKLKADLEKLTGDDIQIRIRTENLSLGESINTICREENADMVIMGISGKSKFEKAFIGSSAINVSQNSKYPVLIVPAHAPVEPVQRILFACDLGEVVATTALDSVAQILDLFHAPLFVLNVEHKNRHFPPQMQEEMYQLHHIFDKYKPGYAFTDNKDITTGITEYAEKNNISLIITIPRHYNFIQQLFHRSTTQKLIYQSPVPLLTLHE
jgi:nucleotide-binding universal stress UspA family protein